MLRFKPRHGVSDAIPKRFNYGGKTRWRRNCFAFCPAGVSIE
jgi:hypothetical protein